MIFIYRYVEVREGWNSRDISYRSILDHPRKRWRKGDDAWPAPSVSVDVGKGETGAGLCNVCDYVGNYSHPGPRIGHWPPSTPAFSASFSTAEGL